MRACMGVRPVALSLCELWSDVLTHADLRDVMALNKLAHALKGLLSGVVFSAFCGFPPFSLVFLVVCQSISLPVHKH